MILAEVSACCGPRNHTKQSFAPYYTAKKRHQKTQNLWSGTLLWFLDVFAFEKPGGNRRGDLIYVGIDLTVGKEPEKPLSRITDFVVLQLVCMFVCLHTCFCWFVCLCACAHASVGFCVCTRTCFCWFVCLCMRTCASVARLSSFFSCFERCLFIWTITPLTQETDSELDEMLFCLTRTSIH